MSSSDVPHFSLDVRSSIKGPLDVDTPNDIVYLIESTAAPQTSTVPWTHIVVVDRSWSMVTLGEHVEKMTKAYVRTVATDAGPNDRFCVIDFSTLANVRVPMCDADAASHAMDGYSLTCDGTTNFSMALELALSNTRTATRNHIVIFTDGCSDAGHRDHEVCGDMIIDHKNTLDTIVSCIGIGDGYDPALCGAVTAKSGGYLDAIAQSDTENPECFLECVNSKFAKANRFVHGVTYRNARVLVALNPDMYALGLRTVPTAKKFDPEHPDPEAVVGDAINMFLHLNTRTVSTESPTESAFCMRTSRQLREFLKQASGPVALGRVSVTCATFDGVEHERSLEFSYNPTGDRQVVVCNRALARATLDRVMNMLSLVENAADDRHADVFDSACDSVETEKDVLAGLHAGELKMVQILRASARQATDIHGRHLLVDRNECLSRFASAPVSNSRSPYEDNFSQRMTQMAGCLSAPP